MKLSSSMIIAATATLANAAPTNIKVGRDDVILYGKGRYTVMKRDDFQELEAARASGIAPPKPGYLDTSLYTVSGSDVAEASQGVTKRGEETIIIPGESQRFLGWDILMSTVVKGAPTSISISTGHSVSNSISVGTSTQFTLVKDFLSATMKIDYTESWTSTQSQQFSAEVPVDKFGAFVSNPWTNRETGHVWTGAIGGEGSLTYYQADSFEEKAFGDLTWVDGVISLCTGKEFPLPRCLGEGTL